MADIGSLLGSAGIGGAIGKAIVQLELDTKKYTAEMSAAKGQTVASTNAMAGSFSAFGGLAKAAMLGAGVAVVALTVNAVKAASDQGEALNKARVIFEDSAGSVESFAGTAAKAFGVSKTAALDAASGFGAMLQSAGLATAQSAEMSTALVQLAGDMASFNNIDPTEALEKLRSGLAGEAEPLRRFGVFLSEAAVKSEAYRSGIAAVGAELTEAQKVQARYNIIFEQTAKQQGDFARTADSLPNQIRTLQATFTDLSAEIGTELLPVAVELLQTLTAIVDVIKTLGTPVRETKEAVAELGGELGEFGPKTQDALKGLFGFGQEVQDTDTYTRTFTHTITDANGQLVTVTDTFERTGDGVETFVSRVIEGETATLDLIAALEEEAAALDAAKDAVEALADAQLAAVDPVFAIINAVREDKDAEDALAQARRDLNRITDAGKEGTKAYRDAQDAVAAAVLDAAESHAGLLGAVADLKGEIDDGNTTLRAAKEALRNVAEAAGLSKDEIKLLIDELRTGEQAGRDFGQGLADGITAELPNVVAAAIQIAEAAADAAQRALRAGSPSQVMFELGEDFVQGFVDALESDEDKVVRAAEHIIDQAIRAIEHDVAEVERRLDKVLGKAADLRGAVAGGFGSFLDISGAFSQTDELGVTTGPTAGSIQDFFAQQLAGAQQFADVLMALQAQGVSSALLSQIAGAGPEALPFAQQLLQMGPEGIGGISDAYATIAELAESTAAGLSEEFFGERIGELRDELKGLREDLRQLNSKPQTLRLELRGDQALRQLILQVIAEIGLARASL